jgi:hypothetical protein
VRTVQEIKEDVDRHEKEFPSHGVNCTCMDKLIGELRIILNSTFSNSRPYNSRWEYVVRTAAKFRW